MSSTSDPWREKYRKALLAQEQLEKQLEQKQADIFQAAMSLTQLAEGQDSALDERLKAIRVCARNEDAAGLDRMMGGLSRISQESKVRGNERWKKTASALSTLSKQLTKYSDSDNKNKLKRWSARVGKTPLTPGLMSQQLVDLTDIQASVIAGSGKEKSGLLSKLFGKSEQGQEPALPSSAPPSEVKATSKDPEAVEPAKAIKDVDENTLKVFAEQAAKIEEQESREDPQPAKQSSSAEATSPADGSSSVIDDELSARRPHEQRLETVFNASGNNNNDDNTRDVFSELSPKISRIVNDLLAHFEPPVECIEQKILNTRLRIEKGLTWQELVPTLEDVRDLVMQAYLAADSDYRAYLGALDTELVRICDALGLAADCGQRMNTAAGTLQITMSTELNGLNQALSDHHEVDSLKQTVNDRIHHIEEALKRFGESHSNSLSSQLDQLVAQVKNMESDAQTIQQKLEVERHRATTDSLTELPNREAYQERVFHEYSRWQRYQHPLTIALLDIDHFKNINDSYGHQAGDRVLKVIARSVAKRLREVDFIARFGGEEFVMIFPETSAENTLTALNNIRQALAEAPFTFKDEPVNITASFGIAEFVTGESIDDVFARADEALYKAKALGRNQCHVDGVKSST